MNCSHPSRFAGLMVACLLLPLWMTKAHATDLSSDRPIQFAGIPTVLPSGDLMLDGHDVVLFGIEPLASDQQCWHEERAWNCGEEALIAFRHHLAGRHVHCTAKSLPTGKKIKAQCLMKSATKDDDLARYLVAEGWARDKPAESGGVYAGDEEKARHLGKGIWTSRFQSAEDWKNGIPNYIEYQKTLRPSSQPAASLPQQPH